MIVNQKASSTVAGASTALGNSPCAACMANSKSPCSVLVGKPMAGPARCPSTTTMGVSVIPARPSPSTMRQNPPPEVAVIERTPAKEAPITIFTAAISSSGCTTAMSKSLALLARYSIMGVVGVMGYAAINLQPAASAPRAMASLPESNILLPSPMGVSL